MDNQDNQNIKVKRTKEDIKLYNRLYYAYVRKNDKYYQHYAKEYHANNKDFYKNIFIGKFLTCKNTEDNTLLNRLVCIVIVVSYLSFIQKINSSEHFKKIYKLNI